MTSPEPSGAFVLLEAFPNMVAARLAAGLLESEGIEVRFADEFTSSLYPLEAVIGGVKLLVPDYSLASARAILADAR